MSEPVTNQRGRRARRFRGRSSHAAIVASGERLRVRTSRITGAANYGGDVHQIARP